MADSVSGRSPRYTASSGGASRQRPPSRLQRQAPASLQISPAAPQWNVAIPLLTPLATSPASPPRLTTGGRPAAEAAVAEQSRDDPPESKKQPVFKKWQHPAAPFCCEMGPRRPSFVPG